MSHRHTQSGISLAIVAIFALAGCERQPKKVGALLPSFADELLKYREAHADKLPKPSESSLTTLNDWQEKLGKKLPDPGLKVGEKAPSFTLPNADGKNISLADELKKGPVLLTFYRGAWCPICNTQLRTYMKWLETFREQGATLIAITPQKPDKSKEEIEGFGYGFEVLSDLDDKVTKAFKLYYEVPPEVDAIFQKEFGLKLEDHNGPGRLGLPVPGTFVIDREGIVRAAFADVNYENRAEPRDLLAALKSLK